MESIQLELYFPNLRKTGYRIESQKTPRYNCIAWAAGVDDRPWWPIDLPPYYWPEEPRVESLAAFISVFQSLGYQVCDNSDREIGFEKVAIYIDEDEIPTHIARQLPSGEWTSKCGDLEDIIHTLEGLEGSYPAYGRVACVMKRPISGS
ncbi:DUF7689 domain-containing protein [Aerosakkonema funiforme]|uniref:DUF7689 domain-containing protein n=1 Tax=Aerosakkonema funiforme TaxID=1246630 RepID=UPI0035B86ED0